MNIYHSRLRKTGAGIRDRTEDILITNQVLYQLSYAGALLTNSFYNALRKVRFIRAAPVSG